MNPVDQVFMDEIQRESYQRALTDDFSIVDIVESTGPINEIDAVTIAAVGAAGMVTASIEYKRRKAIKTLKEIVAKHGMDPSKVRQAMSNSHSNASNDFSKVIWCYRITDDNTGSKKRATIKSIINDFKSTQVYDDLHLSDPEIGPKGTRFEGDAGVIGFRKSLL